MGQGRDQGEQSEQWDAGQNGRHWRKREYQRCPHCGSDDTKSAGTTNDGRRREKCMGCGRSWTVGEKMKLGRKKDVGDRQGAGLPRVRVGRDVGDTARGRGDEQGRVDQVRLPRMRRGRPS